MTLSWAPKKKDPRRLSRRGSLESASLFGLSEALKHLIPGPRGLATTATTHFSTACIHTPGMDTPGMDTVTDTEGVAVVLGLESQGGSVVNFEHAKRIDHDNVCVKLVGQKGPASQMLGHEL